MDKDILLMVVPFVFAFTGMFLVFFDINCACGCVLLVMSGILAILGISVIIYEMLCLYEG